MKTHALLCWENFFFFYTALIFSTSGSAPRLSESRVWVKCATVCSAAQARLNGVNKHESRQTEEDDASFATSFRA